MDVDDSSLYKHILNLGPNCYSKITELVDNTYVSPNLGPSEFSPLNASRNKSVPIKFYFNFENVIFNHPYACIFLKSCKLYNSTS
jgi:hypothetical protein